MNVAHASPCEERPAPFGAIAAGELAIYYLCTKFRGHDFRAYLFVLRSGVIDSHLLPLFERRYQPESVWPRADARPVLGIDQGVDN